MPLCTCLNQLARLCCALCIHIGERIVEDNDTTALRTGEAVDISDGIAAITEAVKITIPGVLEMQLSPADVDVSSIEIQIVEQKKILTDIYAKYNVSSLEELGSLAKIISDSRTKLDNANSRLNLLLGSTSFEEFETTALAITATIRAKEEIESDISALCGRTDIFAFITKNETVIDGYVADYRSINDLKAKAFDLDAELKKAKDSVSAAEDIPAEYLGIIDPDAHLERLQNDLKSKQSRREAALTAKTAAASKLESYKENISGDPTAEAEKTERIFEETKSLLAHWMHIAEG